MVASLYIDAMLYPGVSVCYNKISYFCCISTVSEPLLHFQLPLTAIDRLLYLADQLSNEAYPKSDFIAMLFSPFTVIAGVSDFPQKSKSDVALYALNLWIGYLNPRRQAEFGSALQHRFRTSATHFGIYYWKMHFVLKTLRFLCFVICVFLCSTASAVPIIPKWLNIRCVPNLTPLFLETASNIQQFSNPTEGMPRENVPRRRF